MKLSSLFYKTPGTRPKPRPSSCAPAAIEPLEDRIAPATLVNPTTVTFQDKNGDAVTVTISKPLFNPSLVAKVFTFDTGSVNGSNSTDQQLELLNIDRLGASARDMNISITAVPVSGSPGVVNVGYIKASGIDLGNVTVGGDLGRIAAGDLNFSTPGLASLTVESMGAQGLATQLSGGNLNSKISGPVGAITVNGSIDGASIGIGGGRRGLLGSLLVTGSINGGAGAYSGSVRTQGGITNVEVDGSVLGGAGSNSGIVGTAGALGTVLVKGAITGGGGTFSGAILSTKSMKSVTIDGDIIGGTGTDSGQVGTGATLDAITVDGSLLGGVGALSGVILATGNITTVVIDDSLVGGAGGGSGQVGAGASIGSVTIDDFMSGGAQIHAHLNIQSVSVNAGLTPGIVFPALQTLDPVVVAGIANSSIIANTGSIGSILATGNGATYAIYGTEVVAGAALGDVTATSANGTAIYASHFHAGEGIGNIDGASTSSGEGGVSDGILNSTFRAGNAIASITGTSADTVNEGAGGIVNSGFDAGGSIGPINSTGNIDGSVFIAGIDLGSAFSVTGAGAFNNTSAAGFGFGGSKIAVAANIGNIKVVDNGGVALIEQSTFLAGIHGAGADGAFGTKDDLVAVGSTIGSISSPGGLNTVFVEAGNIGATSSGAIVNTTYISTDTAVTAAGIGPITVNGPVLIPFIVPQDDGAAIAGDAIYNSTFTSNAGIGAINVTLNGLRGGGENAGISTSTFQAGHAIGKITIIDNAYGTSGVNYGLVNSTFKAGLNGYGGTGDISVTLTDAGPDGNSAAIYKTNIDASVCSCMGASMGSLTVASADTSSTAAGIVDSVFRVHGNIGPISATMDSGAPTTSAAAFQTAIQGSTFSAFGSIGAINVYGSVLADANGPSRFLAGYDIGADMTFGNEDLSATSLALQGGQSIGNVTISGYFQGSDIIASINPGSGYVFGDSTQAAASTNDTNAGVGGTIGYVNIGTEISIEGSPFRFDHATSHAIEANTFTSKDSPTVTAFGDTTDIPVVLYVDGGSGDVRITNLTYPIT